MHFKSLTFVLTTCLMFITLNSVAQPTKQHTKPRPKIGLALSGGGARGLAHVGVIKALEEKQIPIDFLDLIYLFERIAQSWADVADLVKPIYNA